MTIYSKIVFFISACLISTIITNIPSIKYYSPQIIAIFSIIITSSYIFRQKIYLSPLIFIIQIIVFVTGGLHSSFLFLEYFLLFSLAFIETPKLILIYSTILILFLSQSIFNTTSLIHLFSFLFIAPLAYFVTQNNQENKKLSYDREETLLWLSLELKQHLQKLPPSKEVTKIVKHANNLIEELEKND